MTPVCHTVGMTITVTPFPELEDAASAEGVEPASFVARAVVDRIARFTTWRDSPAPSEHFPAKARELLEVVLESGDPAQFLMVLFNGGSAYVDDGRVVLVDVSAINLTVEHVKAEP